MEHGKDLVERAIRDLEASPRTSRTGAGRTEHRRDPALVDAINQVFALFRLNYHNQYYSAYHDAEQLNQIKRLWLDSLAGHSTETPIFAFCAASSVYSVSDSVTTPCLLTL